MIHFVGQPGKSVAGKVYGCSSSNVLHTHTKDYKVLK